MYVEVTTVIPVQTSLPRNGALASHTELTPCLRPHCD